MSERTDRPSPIVRSGDLIPASAAPSEALRLVGEMGDEFSGLGIDWGVSDSRSLAETIRAGTFSGLLWVGPKDEAIGLAWPAKFECELGHRVDAYLSRGYRSTSSLGAFIDRLDAPGGFPPLVSVTDPWPGVTAAEGDLAFGPRGYQFVQRLSMRFPAEAGLPTPGATGVTVRPLTIEDEPKVVRLLWAAYDDNPVERALFVRHRDRGQDMAWGARLLLHGELGPWLSDASFTIPADSLLAAATIVNRFHGVLITEVVTHPEHRRRGYAERLLVETIKAVRANGWEPPRLVVTRQNERAFRLYERLGFRTIPGDTGGVWLHRERLGIPTHPVG
ncbi:MAG: GNAT family N-acetyltransferase [Thermoplasmata archaeon]|nr:GNAT family N-acetyltransferase [Thermoplasmata archaeon]